VHLERDLRQAIKNDELILYYQPKIDFHNYQVVGFEALVRWKHPTKGVLPPNLFIPIAEQTSLISDIGRVVIQQTAKQIRQWNLLGFDHIQVSVMWLHNNCNVNCCKIWMMRLTPIKFQVQA
jgi:EAL domain-containing protein (putative c-di-GMP-specific phosphodiesterase class I)